MDWKDKKVLVTGGAGFLGRHVIAALKKEGIEHTIVPRSKDVDLRKREDAEKIVEGVHGVIHLAARVGGIGYNREHPAELWYDNLLMGTHMLHESWRAKVEKFVAVGTICAYPKFTPVPFKEEDLWNGYPEETNAPYGIAKKTVMEGVRAYHAQYGMRAIALLPVNLYGPHDNFNPDSSHVIPALIKKVYDAREGKQDHIDVWGTGTATREFLFVEDAAEGIVKAFLQYEKPDPVNLGSGMEISIKDLVTTIAKIMEYTGEIRWDATKPDGQPRRMLDTSKAEHEFGFKAQTSFREGLEKAIAWYENERREGRIGA
jgi:GDP-L-fucose synthase